MLKFALTLTLASFPVHASTPLKVLIDPGHGGRDGGAERNGTSEATLTLAVARQLEQRLSKDRRFRVQMTRTTDQSLPLAQRARLAKETRADIFVSIHVNSSPDARAKGAEFYFQNQLPPDEESMLLAHMENENESGSGRPPAYEIIERELPAEVSTILTDLLDADRIRRSSQLSAALKGAWRGSRKSKSNSVLQAPFFVLSQVTIPSTLVELGFITNADDYRNLTNPTVQAKMAEDLYQGLLSYWESITKPHASRPSPSERNSSRLPAP